MNEAAVQRAQAYFERMMKNPHKWIRITCKKGNKQDRRDTYEMIKHMLDLAGIKYKLPAKLDHYTIMYSPDRVLPDAYTYGLQYKTIQEQFREEVARKIKEQLQKDTMAIWNGSATWNKTKN